MNEILYLARSIYKYPIDMVDVDVFAVKKCQNQTKHFFIILAMHLEYLKCDRGKKIH